MILRRAESLPAVSAKWSDLKGSWTFVTAHPDTLIMSSAGGGVTDANVYFYDDLKGRILNDVEASMVWAAWSEAVLTDFDELGIPLVYTKTVSAVYPQVIVSDPDNFVRFYINGVRNIAYKDGWNSPMEFYPYEHHKLNSRASGQYISIRFEIPERTYAELNGFDLDIVGIAKR